MFIYAYIKHETKRAALAAERAAYEHYEMDM